MLIYPFIFIMKTLEVCIFSFRSALVTSGERKISSLLGFVEVIVWGFGTGVVVSLVLDNYYLLIPLILGGQVGLILGMKIQMYISKKEMLVMVFLKNQLNRDLITILKENDYGVTTIESNESKKILLVLTKKNRIFKLKNIIKEIDKGSEIVMGITYNTTGGFVY